MFRVELSSERVKGMRVTQEAFPSSSLLQQLSLRGLSSSLFNIALGLLPVNTALTTPRCSDVMSCRLFLKTVAGQSFSK